MSSRFVSRVQGRLHRSWTWYRRQVRKRPTHALLEPTNQCNLNCPFCLVGQQNKLLPLHGNTAHHLQSRPMGTMTEATFDRARQQLKAFGIRGVYLYFQGEPLIHKELVRFARTLKEDGFWLATFTNGLLFNDRIIQPLIDTKIDLIRFSVDGATDDTYKVNRVGGHFEPAYENMRKVAKAAKGTSTRVEWQFIVLRNNEHEVAHAGRMARDIDINFFPKPYRITDEQLAPLNPAYRCTLLKKPCTDIYMQLGIYWNGDVVPCCYDVDGQAIMGNIHETSLDAIWKSPKYQTFRRQVDDFRRHPEAEPELCTTCLRWGGASAIASGPTPLGDAHSSI